MLVSAGNLLTEVPQDRNIVLAQTYEYRHPSPQKRLEAAQMAGDDAVKVTMSMTSRYLGLVVVPGGHVVKIELDEFASQVRGHVGISPALRA